MPKTKLWPYPLKPGTHVIAKVRRLDLKADETIAGTIVQVLQAHARRATVSYAVRTKSGATIQTLAERTTPIDTSTPEGLDQWLDALEDEPDPTLLPGPDLSAGGSALENILWNGPRTGTLIQPGQIWFDTSTNSTSNVSSIRIDPT